MRNTKPLFLILSVIILLTALPAFAGPAPSKTAADQSLEARQADLATISQVLEIDGVTKALEAQGFTRTEVQTRIAELSSEDLSSLAQNLEQVQAAGVTNDQWLWLGLGALVVLILLVV